MTAERQALLARIRAATRRAQPHPGSHPQAGQPARLERFVAAVAAAGGEVHGPFARGELAVAVLDHARDWAAGGRILAEPSAARLLGSGSLEVADDSEDPHAFADVAVALVRGALGVAEDGAVAVLGRDAPDRALLFLAERLVLLVEAESLVADLHTAFRALPGDALRFHHLTWISGPSKTADIEQTLVQGAHGPRQLAVFLHEVD